MSIARRSSATRTTFGRNFLWMTWSGVVTISSSVLVWVLMARLRDIEEVGEFTIVMGLFALFVNLSALGLSPYLVNEISRRSSVPDVSRRSVAEFISSSSVFLVISGVLAAAMMTAAGFFVSESWQVRMSAMVLSLTLLPANLMLVAEASFIAYDRVRFLAVVTTLENLLRVVVPIILIWTGADIISICASFAAIKFFALLVSVAASPVSLRKFAFSGREFRGVAGVSPTFAGTGLFASLSWQAPLFMLAYIGSVEQTAEFGAASRFLVPVSILLASYVNIIHPSIARQFQNDPPNSGSYLSKMAVYPLAASILAAVGAYFLAGDVLGLMFGETYVSAAPTLKVLVASVIPFGIVMVASRGLIATGYQRIDFYANVIGLAACIITGAAAIPSFGAVGAAIAQLACFTSMAIVELAFLARKLGIVWWRRAALSSSTVLLALLWNYQHFRSLCDIS